MMAHSTELTRANAVLPRIQTKRPATFLSSTCDAIESALNDLAETGAFVPNDEQPSKQLTTADAVDAISDFASALLHSPWIPKEDVSSVLCLLYHSLMIRAHTVRRACRLSATCCFRRWACFIHTFLSLSRAAS